MGSTRHRCGTHTFQLRYNVVSHIFHRKSHNCVLEFLRCPEAWVARMRMCFQNVMKFGRQRLLRRLPFRIRDVAGDDVFLIAGAGRSGTTWLEELLNYSHDYRMIFEPFSVSNNPHTRSIGEHPYYPPGKEQGVPVEVYQKIFAGDFRNYWSDRFTPSGTYHKRMVKSIRVNLMLKWLRGTFPNLPIIWLVRHPIATVLSQHGGFNDPMLVEWFGDREELIEKHLSHVRDLIDPGRPLLERRLIRWCIQHLVPLQELQQGDICPVFYEELVLNPVQELSRVLNYLGQPMNAEILDIVDKPSAMNRQGRTTSEQRIAGWRDRLSSEELAPLLSILDRFGLADIWADQPRGNFEAFQNRLADRAV